MSTPYHTIIVGGSYAGLSAAMSLGRSLRRVLILDSGEPCNRSTPHSHNFLTHDGETPAAIASKGRAAVLAYPTVTFQNDLAVSGRATANGFLISTQSGTEYEAQKLIFATGIRDLLPDISGFAACWGISAIHCPYCHGYEYRGEPTAIFAHGDRAMHIAGLVRNLTPHLTILTSGGPAFTPEQSDKLRRHNIPFINTAIAELEHEVGMLKRIHFTDGATLSATALYAALPFAQHSDIPVGLGCDLTEGGYIQVDPFGKTTVDGVFACGDSTSMFRSVANAVHTGSLAGAMVNKSLSDEAWEILKNE